MLKFAGLIADRYPGFRRWANRMFYQFLALVDDRGEVTLMNYGYTPLSHDVPLLPLNAPDEPNRLCLQLYHHVADAVDLRDKDVLEVGSGRGGGAAYINRAFSPKTTTGVDYSERAVAFCQEAHKQPGLSFVYGDAEALPFEDQQFDVVINVESSHGYGSMRQFLTEALRVLKPGGHLLWADFRAPREIDGLDEEFRAAGFETISTEVITDHVLGAMEMQGERYRALIKRKVPFFARGLFYHYAGVEGTGVFNALRSGDLIYLHRVLLRPG